MHLSLFFILATVPHTLSRRVVTNDASISEPEESYSEDLFDDTLTQWHVGGNCSTHLLQLKLFENCADHNTSDEQAKADLADLIAERTAAQLQFQAEMEFEAVLRTAISELMAKAKAVAQAAHDQVYHHGYYRAVKAERAAQAAGEAVNKALTAAVQKAKVVGREVVLKKMLEHTDLGSGATVGQLLQNLNATVKNFVQRVHGHCHKYPKIVGLHGFLEQVRALEKQIRARSCQAFDSEVMTKLMLLIISVTNKALYFEYLIENEVHGEKRAVHQNITQDMSSKMQSEIGLDRFLKHITLLEETLKAHEEFHDVHAVVLKVKDGLNS